MATNNGTSFSDDRRSFRPFRAIRRIFRDGRKAIGISRNASKGNTSTAEDKQGTSNEETESKLYRGFSLESVFAVEKVPESSPSKSTPQPIPSSGLQAQTCESNAPGRLKPSLFKAELNQKLLSKSNPMLVDPSILSSSAPPYVSPLSQTPTANEKPGIVGTTNVENGENEKEYVPKKTSTKAPVVKAKPAAKWKKNDPSSEEPQLLDNSAAYDKMAVRPKTRRRRTRHFLAGQVEIDVLGDLENSASDIVSSSFNSDRLSPQPANLSQQPSHKDNVEEFTDDKKSILEISLGAKALSKQLSASETKEVKNEEVSLIENGLDSKDTAKSEETPESKPPTNLEDEVKQAKEQPSDETAAAATPATLTPKVSQKPKLPLKSTKIKLQSTEDRKSLLSSPQIESNESKVKRTKTFGGVATTKKEEKVDIEYLLELRANFQKKTATGQNGNNEDETLKNEDKEEAKNLFQSDDKSFKPVLENTKSDTQNKMAEADNKDQDTPKILRKKTNHPDGHKKLSNKASSPEKVIPVSNAGKKKSISTPPTEKKIKTSNQDTTSKEKYKSASIKSSHSSSPTKMASSNMEEADAPAFYGVKLRKVSSQSSKHDDKANKLEEENKVILRKVSQNSKDDIPAKPDETSQVNVRKFSQDSKRKDNSVKTDEVHKTILRKVSSNSTQDATSPEIMDETRTIVRQSSGSVSFAVDYQNSEPNTTPKTVRRTASKEKSVKNSDAAISPVQDDQQSNQPSWISLARRHTERFKEKDCGDGTEKTLKENLLPIPCDDDNKKENKSTSRSQSMKQSIENKEKMEKKLQKSISVGADTAASNSSKEPSWLNIARNKQKSWTNSKSEE